MLADRTIVMMFSAAVSSSAASREKENATNAASSSSSLKQPPPYTATSAFISNTKRYMQAQAATKQELSFAPVEGNGAANRRRRQSTADASLSARRGSSDRSSGSPPPSYGVDDYYSSAAPETRNGQKEGFHWYGNEERPNKKSSGGVSDRYEKTGRTSDWGSEPRVHDADLAMAIAALEQPINTNDTLINSWFGIQRARITAPNNRNKQINNINGHLRGTKREKVALNLFTGCRASTLIGKLGRMHDPIIRMAKRKAIFKPK